MGALCKMIPVFVALFGEYIAPEWLVSKIMALVPFSVASPYMALVYAVALVYLPFGLSVVYKVRLTNGKDDNLAPRKQSELLAATNDTYSRLLAAEKNMQEGFLIFAAALLAAVQAGVPKATVSLYASFWLLVRAIFIAIYVVQCNNLLGAMRSLMFAFSLATTTKLLY